MLTLPDKVSFSFPTAIDFGIGVRRGVAPMFKERGCKRPLIVTDAGLAKLPLIHDLEVLFSGDGLEPQVFSGIVGNPVESQVKAGITAYREGGCASIIAVGGGAAMDVAKVIGVMVNHPGEIFDYEDGKPDGLPVDKELPLLVCLPTTAGTGSEVGRSSVISEDESKVKRIIFSPRMMPEKVFADPELTLQLPAKITAATGIDALTHLLEAYLAKGYHPMCDGIALEGIRMVSESLKICCDFAMLDDDEVDLEGEAGIAAHAAARGQMMLAALMGAVAFQKGLGMNHSCAHALSTVCDLHHGLANGMVLPYSMDFNERGVPEKFRRIEMMAGIPSFGFGKWVRTLKADIGLPGGLSECGVTMDHVDELVAVSLKDPCHQLNPVDVTADDFRNVFILAMDSDD